MEEMNMQEAMLQLRSMFDNFDEETIRTVLASNDGHVEKTIDDLVRLAEDVEKQPDDDNLFADNNVRPTRVNDHRNFAARSAQEDEDAKMAYELQRQYMQEEQNANRNARNNNNNKPQMGYSQSRKQDNNRFDYGNNNQMPPSNVNMGQSQANPDKKKSNFMKKVKIGLQNLFKRKGKFMKKNPASEYQEFEPMQERLTENAYGMSNGPQFEEEESPMKLSDVLGNQGIHRGNIERENRDDSREERLDKENRAYRDKDESPRRGYDDRKMRNENIRRYNEHAHEDRRENDMISPNHFDYN